jgi:hypothetical protein
MKKNEENKNLDYLIEYFELEKLEKEKQERYASELSSLVNDEIMNEAITLLNKEENEELEEVLDKSDDFADIEAFLRKKIENFDDLIKHSLEKIKRMFIAGRKA